MPNQNVPIIEENLSKCPTPDGKEPSLPSSDGTSVNSCSALSPEVVPTLLLDAMTIMPRIRVNANPTPQTLKLPNDLEKIFGTRPIRISNEGLLKREKNYLGTNGALLLRTEYGLPNPSGVKRNEINLLLEGEKELLKAAMVDKRGADIQWAWALKRYCELLEYLESNLGSLHIPPMRLIRFEVCRDYPIQANREEFLERVKPALNQIFGGYARDANPVGSMKKDTGEYLKYNLPIPKHLTIKKTKHQAVELKVYEKGDCVRVELAFVNFAVPGFPVANVGKEKAIKLLDAFAGKLIDEGQRILDRLHPDLFNKKLQVDVAKLKKKLSADLRIKSVNTDLSILNLIKSLANEGAYTPAEWKDTRIKGERLRRLTDSVHGVLEEIKVTHASKTKRKSYKLRDDWESRAPFPPSRTEILSSSKDDQVVVKDADAVLPITADIEMAGIGSTLSEA